MAWQGCSRHQSVTCLKLMGGGRLCRFGLLRPPCLFGVCVWRGSLEWLMNQSIQTVHWNLGWRPSFVGRYRSRCAIRAVSLSTFHFPGGLIVNVLVVIVIVTCDYDCDYDYDCDSESDSPGRSHLLVGNCKCRLRLQHEAGGSQR